MVATTTEQTASAMWNREGQRLFQHNEAISLVFLSALSNLIYFITAEIVHTK